MLLSSDQLESVFKLIKKDSLNNNTKVLVLVSPQCDSICAALILANLFKQEFILYTIRPVHSYEELLVIGREDIQNDAVVSVVLINCGGYVDLPTFLALPEDRNITLYVLDNHLPYHNNNVENETQVFLFNTEDPDAEEEENENGEESTESSQSTSEDDNYKRPASKGKNVGAFFGRSASRIMYELADQLKKKNREMLWLAIVGLTDYYIHGLIDERTYERELKFYKQEVNSEDQSSSMDIDKGFDDRITFNHEYRFLLYRHWTLYDSLYYSKYIATRLGVWKENGKKRLLTLLVRMGLPMAECTNKWSSMNVDMKHELREKLPGTARELYGLDSITYKSFYKREGFKLEIAAADVVLSVSALLENSSPQHFWQAFDALSGNIELLQDGIQRAIRIQEAIVHHGTALIDKNIIVKSGPFRYAFINQSGECPIFTHPLALLRLGEFVKEALTEFGKTKNKPLCICSFNEKESVYLISGFMAGAPTPFKKNKFGFALEQAAARTQSRIKKHEFYSAVLEILRDDAKKFIDYLHSGQVV